MAGELLGAAAQQAQSGISGITSLIGSLIQNRQRQKFGKKQLAEAKALKPDPITYTTPTAIDEYSKLLGGLSREGLPGERMIAEQMGAGYAGAAGEVGRVADTGAGALGAMSGLYGKYINSIRDLGIQSAQVKAQNEMNYRTQNANAALTRADYADKAWEYNVNIPYQRALNKSESLENAGYQNIFGAADAANAGMVDYNNYQSSQMSNMMQMLPYMGFGTGAANKVQTPTATPAFTGQMNTLGGLQLQQAGGNLGIDPYSK